MCRHLPTLVALLGCAIVSWTEARAQETTPPVRRPLASSQRVVDEAGMLDAETREALFRISRRAAGPDAPNLQIVVLDSLRGEDMDSFLRRQLRLWGAHGRGPPPPAGVLLVVHDTGQIGLRLRPPEYAESARPSVGRVWRSRVVPAFAPGGSGESRVEAVQALLVALGAEPRDVASPGAARDSLVDRPGGLVTILLSIVLGIGAVVFLILWDVRRSRAEPGARLVLGSGKDAARAGRVAAANVTRNSPGLVRSLERTAAGIVVGRIPLGRKLVAGAAFLSFIGGTGVLLLVADGEPGVRRLGWGILAATVPLALLLLKPTDEHFIVRPDGLERVGAWGKRRLMPWGEFHEVRLVPEYSRGLEVVRWSFLIRGIASGQWGDFRIQLESSGIGDLATAIRASVPETTLAREPEAAAALAALAER